MTKTVRHRFIGIVLAFYVSLFSILSSGIANSQEISTLRQSLNLEQSPQLHPGPSPVQLQKAIRKLLTSNSLAQLDVPGECYTSYFTDVLQGWDTLSRDQQESLAPLFSRPDNPRSFYYRENGLPFIYTTRHFKCHYTMSGPYAVPSEDISPADGIPDYVQIAAEAYEKSARVIVGLPDAGGFEPVPPGIPPGTNSSTLSMGYRLPPLDYWVKDNGGDERWDIYFITGPFGAFTAGEYMVESVSSTSAVYSAYFATNTQYYRWLGKLRGAKALQTTCAHEFFHSVQFAYNIYMPGWFKEACSTWIETRVYKGEEFGEADGHQFIEDKIISWFLHPDRSLEFFDGDHEYGDVIFILYLSEKFGDGIVKELFEGMTEGIFRYLFNFQRLFSTKNTTLANVFKEFTAWNALTGNVPDKFAPKPKFDLNTKDPSGNLSRAFHYVRGDKYPLPAVYLSDVHNIYPVSVEYSGQESPDHMATKYVRFLPTVPGQSSNLSIRVNGKDIDEDLYLSLLLVYGLGGWGVKVLEIDYDNSTVVVDEIIPYLFSQEGQINIPGFGNPIDEVVLVLSNLDPEFDHVSTISYTAAYTPEVAVKDLSVSADDNGFVKLTWSVSVPIGIAGFKIIRKDASLASIVRLPESLSPEEVYRAQVPENKGYGYLATDVVASIGPDQLSYIDSTAFPDAYYYAVVPFDGNGIFGKSAIASLPIIPIDTRAPVAELSLKEAKPRILSIEMAVSEYLPVLSNTPKPEILVGFPDGSSTTLALEPLTRPKGNFLTSRFWSGTLEIPIRMSSGDLGFSATLEDKGRNRVSGPSALNGTRSYYFNAVDLPEVFVYPNPFRRKDGKLTFDFKSKPNEKLEVKIYTIAGELVRILDSSPEEVQGNKAIWDLKNEKGRGVFDGIYIYRALIGNSTSTGKVAITR